MASIQPCSSSGYNRDSQMEEKKTNKMLNCESAKRTRMRKQKQLENLNIEVNKLQGANKKLGECIKAKEEAYIESEAANNILRAQTKELADRLCFLNSITQVVKDNNHFSIEISRIKPL
ncbi:bZIP transcription factor 53 [Cajanus cajan]|uniref:Ocs element-binding factor 1 n=1 Tax=Cajanus cajan TaxID=3821 RepID=A0A151RYE1_CAJCA|nr:bZIP transcription factor 53 [Cajanus cajan]KYP47573.1 Ocs element-binding factor 1 [Cajanus cajan]